MTKAIVISERVIREKLLVLFALAVLLVTFICFALKPVWAEDASSSGEVTAKKYNITFPVAELGNCNSIIECKAYCADSTHQDACVAFAKKKRFYKENQSNSKIQSLIEKAKLELGCSSAAECKAFCSKEANQDKCRSFAQKHSLGDREKEATPSGKILDKAKSFLGCDSYEACKAFCQKSENREKCGQFSRMIGLEKGDKSGSESGRMKPPKEGSQSGRFMPNSDKAFEHANENAKFCREHPEKCKNATGSGISESHQGLQTNRSNRPTSTNFNAKNSGPSSFNQEHESQVQGISTSSSFLERIFHLFFK